MPYLGDFAPNDIIYFNFTTLDTTASPPVPYTASGVTVSVYKDDSNTQTTTGVTVTNPFDSVTGLINVKIDTATDGTFYATGHFFQAIVTAGTVNGTSIVGYVLDSFTLQKVSALRPTTAARTLDVSATGEAGLDFDNIKDASSSHTLTNITVPTVTTTATATALGAAYDAAKTAAQAGDVMKVSSGTGANQISLSSGLVRLSSTGVQDIWDALTSALTTSGSIGKLLVDKIDTVLSTLATASALTTLTNRVGAFTGTGINTVLGFLKAIMKKDAAATPSDVGGTYDNTTDSLEAIKDSGLSVSGSVNVSSMDAGVIGASQIAANAITSAKIATDAIGAAQLASDAVTEIQSGLSTLTQANVRTAVGLGSANLDTQLSTIAGYIDTEVAAIKAKTDNLPPDPADASDVAAAVQAVKDYADRTVIRGTVSGTSPTTTSFTCSALDVAGTVADQFKGRILIFDKTTTTAALRGQATDISASSVATLPVLTFTALTTAPAATDSFSIV